MANDTEQQKPFWLVWSPQGTHPPEYRHTNVTSATHEAERLARLHPGRVFFVLQSVCARQLNDMHRVDLRPEITDLPF